MKKKTRCTVIGDYLEPLERPLREKGILFDVMIQSVSPFAMAADVDETNMCYCEDRELSMSMLLNLRKNLSQMLSRNPEHFCQNYNLQPPGKEVRYLNDTDYIIIMNTVVEYDLFQKGDVIYSDTKLRHPFITGLEVDKRYTRHKFPFINAFNWKYFYDKFIDTILKEYDKDHIILIRVNSAQWYMDTTDLKSFDSQASQYRNRVEQIDRYFLERTGCLCIEEHFNHIPHKYEDSSFAYVARSGVLYDRLEYCIEEIIDGKCDSYRINIPEKTTPLTRSLYWKLSSDIQKSNAELLRLIQNNCGSIPALKTICGSSFFENLDKLKKFLDIEHSYTLTDYVLENAEDIDLIDMDLVRLYIKYMKLDINDTIAIYMLSLRGAGLSELREFAELIVNHSDCQPALAAKKFRDRNIMYLQNYQYIQPELKELYEDSKLMIWIGNNCYLVIDPLSDVPFKKVELDIKKKVDYMAVINDDYVCPIEAADALCASWAFYIERAKRAEGNRPVSIVFVDKKDFYESLHYIDYTDILENENFVISTSGYSVDTSNHSVKCNLEFLFEKNVKICMIRYGLSDQICFYIFGKQLEEASKSCQSLNSASKVYYDDTTFLYFPVFNGLEIDKFATEDLDSRLLSKLISRKLLNQINQDCMLPDILYRNGCDNLGFITNDKRVLETTKYCGTVYIPKVARKIDRFLKQEFDLEPPYYSCLVHPEHYMITRKLDLDQYIRFPDFEDETNRNIAHEMLSCDAVVVHVRLGDFVTVGHAVDNRYFYESIQKLLKIPGYANKKFYVFSDNIPWIKLHHEEYGLDLVSCYGVSFVDHNKGENSYRDLQLMTLAKVIIASQSGLVRMAALLSKRCEQFISPIPKVVALYERIGRKNKHDTQFTTYADFSAL